MSIGIFFCNKQNKNTFANNLITMHFILFFLELKLKLKLKIISIEFRYAL